jgi:hypothetical protein
MVTPMIAAFPLVAFAIVLLEERLAWWQAAGALCAVAEWRCWHERGGRMS